MKFKCELVASMVTGLFGGFKVARSKPELPLKVETEQLGE